ncbi:hypothetical protein, partial [Vibrio vulnificus]|uniref:hypothetical protein n=1 Tax=Vibrio vulnificus TaxID=672 RepID=UPI0039B68C72
GYALDHRVTALATEFHAWIPECCAYLGVRGPVRQVVVSRHDAVRGLGPLLDWCMMQGSE